MRLIFIAMETLLLLHGAIGAADQLQPLAQALEATYMIHTLNFSGHGGKVLGHGEFSMELFANDVLSYIQFNGLGRVSVFGYSMGGYVAMYLARNYPDKINKVITLATKYQWDEAIAAREVQMLNPEKIELKLPAFAATLQQRHKPNDWTEVLGKTATLMASLGADNPLQPSDYALVNAPVLILLGDRDKMVSLEETLAVFKLVPGAQMGVLPGTQHPIEQVDVESLSYVVRKFLG